MAVQSAHESEGDLAGAAPGCVRSRESAGCDVGLGSPRATGRPAARGDQQAEEIGGTPWVDRFAESGFVRGGRSGSARTGGGVAILLSQPGRSEEHTSELQSQSNLVCRLLLEKKKIK